MNVAVDPAVGPQGLTRAREGLALHVPESGERAHSNLRSHLLRGLGRLLVLASADVGAIWLGRGLLRALRGGAAGSGVGDIVNGVLPPGTVSFPQLAVAMTASLFVLGGYRDGDRWRDPAKILRATALGVVVTLYANLWHETPLLIAGRALALWMVIGSALVLARSIGGVAVRRWEGGRLQRRVLEIRTEGVEEPLDLGPMYKFVTSLYANAIPLDVRTMERWLRGGIDTIVVRGEMPGHRLHFLTDFALTHGCRLLCAPYHDQLLGVEKTRVWVQGHPLVELTTPALRASHLVLKRALDVAVAFLAILVLSPLLLALALWIRLDSRGPVIFRQRRPGFQGRPFEMLKFRSMRMDAEAFLAADPVLHDRFLQNGCKLPLREDPRVTRAGRFLRRTSLDEIPQLFNVIRGDMSLVGPRPLVGPELENYDGKEQFLLSVKPGMTGLWQVSGRSEIAFPERAEIDLEYVRTWSFIRDLWILFLTPAAVLMGRGAH